MTRSPEAVLVLEDGTSFRGRAFGAEGEAFGEAVFNTSMSGYQEVLTDPSYAAQIVTMTYPHQGNYGVNSEDPESRGIQVAGFVVREASRRPSSWRSERSLQEELGAAGVVGIEGIDTRRLTLRIRSAGAMRCAISTEDLDPASLGERVRQSPGMEGADLAKGVSTREPYEARDVVGPADGSLGRVFRVAAYDFGIKHNILRLLASHGCQTTVFPAETLGTHYVRTARAKGASETRVLTRHALPNVIAPTIVMLAMDAGTAIGISIYIETVYGLPGIGSLVLNALRGEQGYDLPLILGVMFVSATAIIVLNALADVAARLIDPRIESISRSRAGGLRTGLG